MIKRFFFVLLPSLFLAVFLISCPGSHLEISSRTQDELKHVSDETLCSTYQVARSYYNSDTTNLENEIINRLESKTFLFADECQDLYPARLIKIYSKDLDNQKIHKALSRFERQLDLHRKNIDPIREANALTSIGLIHYRIGNYEQALQFFTKALEIDSSQSNLSTFRGGLYTASRKKTRNFTNIGMVYNSLGQHEKALAQFEKALAMDEDKIFDFGKRGEAINLYNIGMTHFYQGNYDKGLLYFEKSIFRFFEMKSPDGESDCLFNMGRAYMGARQYKKALEHFYEALKTDEYLFTDSRKARDLLHIGLVFNETKNFNMAADFIKQSLQVYLKLNELDSLWYSQSSLAEVMANLGKFQDAVKLYNQALDTIETLRSGIIEKDSKTAFMQDKFHIYDEFISFLAKLDKRFPKKGYAQKAFEIFEQKQGRLFLEEMAKSGARYFANVPKEIINEEYMLEKKIRDLNRAISVNRANDTKKENMPLVLSLEKKLNNTRNEIRIFNDKIRERYPNYFNLKNPQPVSLNLLQTNVINDEETILVYFVTDSKTFLWTIDSSNFSMHTLNIGRDELYRRVMSHRNAILKLADNSMRGIKITAGDNAERKLHENLTSILVPKSVRDSIFQSKALYIVPTDSLYFLPFESLASVSGNSRNKYLIEDYSISYLTSASLLNIIRQHSKNESMTSQYPLLAFANPQYTENQLTSDDITLRGMQNQRYRAVLGGQFAPLPETEDEVREIKKILNASDKSHPLWLKDDASVSNILKMNEANTLDDYQYLVFACHGILPGEVDSIMQPALVLSNPDPYSQKEGYLKMADVFSLKLNANLVALSACNTGNGKYVKGEGVMGMTRAFMYAGTPTVTVTMWSVESISAKTLNVGLFENMRKGNSHAESLRQIKIHMIRGNEGKKWKHPFYWAPVVLFGDGGIN